MGTNLSYLKEGIQVHTCELFILRCVTIDLVATLDYH